jgi:ABC-type multidrug transport system ATPase subunit
MAKSWALRGARVDKPSRASQLSPNSGSSSIAHVKEYSSGMYVRLAFATAIHVEPEILIVDEALAVGDAIFANRCIQKFEETQAEASHDPFRSSQRSRLV